MPPALDVTACEAPGSWPLTFTEPVSRQDVGIKPPHATATRTEVLRRVMTRMIKADGRDGRGCL